MSTVSVSTDCPVLLLAPAISRLHLTVGGDVTVGQLSWVVQVAFFGGRGAVVAKNPKSDRDQTGEDVQTGVVGRRLIQEVCNMLCLSEWWDHILFGFPHNDLC